MCVNVFIQFNFNKKGGGMKKIIILLLAVIMVFGANITVQAAALDLSGWSAQTLDFPGGQTAGSWSLGPGNTSVTQTINADPSFYLNNLNQTSYSIDGTWQGLTSGDDDYMGFVFGYQNSSNFYLFDWKQGKQAYQGQTAFEGMTIKKFTGATGNGLVDLSLAEFWENGVDVGGMSILAKNQGSTKGWVTNKSYNFLLDFNLTPGDINIVIKDGATTLWDVNVNDTTFTSGEFGFYNNSQQNVKYAGFEQTGGTVVTPEPATMLLFGTGLIGAFVRKKRKV